MHIASEREGDRLAVSASRVAPGGGGGGRGADGRERFFVGGAVRWPARGVDGRPNCEDDYTDGRNRYSATHGPLLTGAPIRAGNGDASC
jgi:hypothetical protein